MAVLSFVTTRRRRIVSWTNGGLLATWLHRAWTTQPKGDRRVDRRRPRDHQPARFINPETGHPPFGYSHVVELTAGRPVYIAGQVALDPTSALVGTDDIRVQTRQVFDNLRAALEAVGAGFEQVVKLNFYRVDATPQPTASR
jgi:enamine deaminase RidA (YjgF/YER057c/UK114 family)